MHLFLGLQKENLIVWMPKKTADVSILIHFKDSFGLVEAEVTEEPHYSICAHDTLSSQGLELPTAQV